MKCKLKITDFIKPESDQRMHATATVQGVTVHPNQTISIDFEIEECFGSIIPEISRFYHCNLPAVEKAKVSSPYNYRSILESILYTLHVDESGNVDLAQIIGRTYLLSIQKKVYETQGYVFYNTLNMIPYDIQEEPTDEGNDYSFQEHDPYESLPDEVYDYNVNESNQTDWNSLQQLGNNVRRDGSGSSDPRNGGFGH
jgi:hypothetical protein